MKMRFYFSEQKPGKFSHYSYYFSVRPLSTRPYQQEFKMSIKEVLMWAGILARQSRAWVQVQTPDRTLVYLNGKVYFDTAYR